MDSGAYWQGRAEQRVLMGDKSASELAQTMRTLYDRALADINKEIEAFYGRYAAQNGLTLADVKKRLNPAELKSARRHLREYYERVDELAKVNGRVDPALLRRYKTELRELSAKSYVSRLEELKANFQDITFNLGVKENEAFYQTLSDLFSEGYFHNIYDVQRFLGGYAGWEISLNPRVLESALREKWLGMNFSERIWTNKGKLLNELETTFLSGVARGLNPREIARAMSKNCGASYYACERLARTESANIIETATAKSYEEYGIKKYQFLATFDRRVCETCASLDAKIFNLKDKQVGINYAPLHPNCYDAQTEVFTRRGWRRFKDCNEEDLFYSLNPDTLVEEYVGAEKLVAYEYRGEMLRFHNLNLDLCVTPNHRMAVRYGGGDRIEFIDADKLPMRDCFIPCEQPSYLLERERRRVRSAKIWVNVRNLKREALPYEDFVYCAELKKNYILLVRRNGKIAWCGNCRCTTIPYFPIDDIDELYGLPEKLVRDENNRWIKIPMTMSYDEWKKNYVKPLQKN